MALNLRDGVLRSMFYVCSAQWQEGEMDRKDQLRNVAFGGAWSEQIAGREQLLQSLQRLHQAAALAIDHDLRTDPDVTLALWRSCKDHPKGEMLHLAWGRAAGLPNPGLRVQELRRIAALLEEGHRGRLK